MELPTDVLGLMLEWLLLTFTTFGVQYGVR